MDPKLILTLLTWADLILLFVSAVSSVCWLLSFLPKFERFKNSRKIVRTVSVVSTIGFLALFLVRFLVDVALRE